MAWSIDTLEAIRPGATLTDAAAWLTACAETEDGKVVVLRQGPVMLPLCWRKKFGLVVVESLGQEYRSVAGPIIAEGEAMPALNPEDLPVKADLIDLRRFPKEYLDVVFPSSPARFTRFDILRFDRALNDSGDAFLASLSKGTRKDLRYSIHRVEKMFGEKNVHCQSVKLREDNWEETWERAADFVQHSWQGRSKVSVVTDNKKKEFLFRLMKNKMVVKIHFYCFSDVVSAMAITMESNGHVLIYSHEYHSDYAKYQPGHILNFQIILDAIANGLTALDFGVGATQHKYSWQCDSKDLWRIMVPLTWKGHLALAYQKTRWRIAALRDKKETA